MLMDAAVSNINSVLCLKSSSMILLLGSYFGPMTDQVQPTFICSDDGGSFMSQGSPLAR